MDAFTLMMFRLELYIIRIRALYSYIFKFFLPAVPEEDEDNKGIFDKNTDNIRL